MKNAIWTSVFGLCLLATPLAFAHDLEASGFTTYSLDSGTTTSTSDSLITEGLTLLNQEESTTIALVGSDQVTADISGSVLNKNSGEFDAITGRQYLLAESHDANVAGHTSRNIEASRLSMILKPLTTTAQHHAV